MQFNQQFPDEPPSPERDRWWHSMLPPMSRLIAETLQGFAAYGEAMYPICFDLGEDLDCRGSAERLQWEDRAWHSSGFAEPDDVARSASERTASPSLSVWITSPFVKLWSRRRRRERRQTIAELRSLDDRTLEDIGISRYPTEYFPRNW